MIASALAVVVVEKQVIPNLFANDDSEPFVWGEIAPLAVPTASPSVVTLPNGDVLVTGGLSSGSTPTATTEIWDTVRGVWKPGPNMVVKRVGHTATLLDDGTILISGGVTGSGVTSSAEILNITARSSLTLPSMTFARASHSAILLSNGKVLVTGGSDFVSNTWRQAELYDPATHRWLPGGTMALARVSFAMTMLPDGTPLAIGGDKNGTSEKYNPSTNSWSGTLKMISQRSSFGSVTLRDGRVLVSGGLLNSLPLKTAEIFDPSKSSWAATGSMGTARASFSITAMKNGSVLVAGSYSQQGTTNTSEFFHPSNSTWTKAPPMVIARGGQGFARLANGTVLAVGGRTAVGVTSSVELFGPARKVTPPPPPPIKILRPIDLVPYVQLATELPGNSANGLISKLEAAQAKYDLKDFPTCINIMNAFYHQVKAFSLSDHMTRNHTETLYSGYVSVVEGMGGTPLPPIPDGLVAHAAWVFGRVFGAYGSTTILAVFQIPVR